VKNAHCTCCPEGSFPPPCRITYSGKVVANAALVPAGETGSISEFASNPSDVILDTDGYFGTPGCDAALSFYPVTPCRVADTRRADGTLGEPEMAAGTTRSFAVPPVDRVVLGKQDVQAAVAAGV
jgi:hypothetical protein